MNRKHRDLEARLIANSVREGECWIWFGNATVRGYPRLSLRVNGKHTKLLAHRVSFEVFKGEALGDRHIDHLCTNPRCINPDHLQAVTIEENNRRRDYRRRSLSVAFGLDCL